MLTTYFSKDKTKRESYLTLQTAMMSRAGFLVFMKLKLVKCTISKNKLRIIKLIHSPWLIRISPRQKEVIW
jgi:hypothetical protein